MAKTIKTNQSKIAVLSSTDDLTGDAANPRKIKAAAANGLSQSLKKFGDLRLSGKSGRKRSAGYFHFPEQFEEVCFAHPSVFLL
jgi:hypothetical protein